VGTGSEDLVQIYATADITDGYLMKGRLEAEGIPVLVKGEGEGPYRMGPVSLWVPGTLEVQARMIVESIESSGADEAGRPDAVEDEVPVEGSGEPD